MCNFCSFTSDGEGNVLYFDAALRAKCLSAELNYNPDSHTSINDYFGFKGAAEDCRNKYEYNPLTGKFTVDQINTTDDSDLVRKTVEALDFATIVPELIIKPVVHPFRDRTPPEVTDREIGLLREWASVGDSVGDSVWDSVRDSVRASVGASVWASVWDSVRASVGASVRASVGASVRASVWDSVWDSVGDSVWDSVGDSVRYSVWAYISSFFALDKWQGVDHAPGENPFQPCIDLWELGLVPSFDGTVWRLHGGESGGVLLECEAAELKEVDEL